MDTEIIHHLYGVFLRVSVPFFFIGSQNDTKVTLTAVSLIRALKKLACIFVTISTYIVQKDWRGNFPYDQSVA